MRCDGMKDLNFKTFLFALVVLVLGSVAGRADIVRTERVESELVNEYSTVAPGQTLWIGLRQKLIPHWHTYWKNPGDSGEPTSIEWTLPDGASIGEIQWPAPKPIDVGPLRNFGYEGEYFLLSRLTVPNEGLGDQLDIRAKAYWLVCEEICIPEEGELTLSLPVDPSGPVADPIWASEIEATLAGLPRQFDGAAHITIEEDLTLSLAAPEIADVLSGASGFSAFFFPEKDGYIENAADQLIMAGEGGISLQMQPGFRIGKEDAPERMSGVLVVTNDVEGLDDAQVTAFEVDAVAGPVLPGTADRVMLEDGEPVSAFGIGLGQALIFGLLGGLILNLMPCVFPILSLKALAFVKESSEPARIRVGGLAYTAGVIATFLALALILIGIRAGGEAAGWAFHLQNPLVLALLTYLMFAVGLNLSGVFNVGMAVNVAGGGTGASGSFMTGVLAVVIASPCTAPFMASALGFALTQGTLTTLAVFGALGLGMAIPYLALSFSPSLINLMPKPGPWMDGFKQVLAFPVYLTAAWLLWVLSKQISPDSLFLVLIGIVCVGFGAWLFGRLPELRTKSWQWSGAAASAMVIVISLLLLQGLTPRESVAGTGEVTSTSENRLSYIEYSPETVDALLAEGKTVFANFTADWCITCKVNERVALDRPKVVSLFNEMDVVAVKGDWTNRNEEIARTLQAHGSPGVPLYLVYRPDGTGGSTATVEPMKLPQILTQKTVLDALSLEQE